MRLAPVIIILTLATIPGYSGSGSHKEINHRGGAKVKLSRSTPIQYVDSIEPNLDFWVNRLGFAKTVEVPTAGKELDFVILEKDGLEVMLQTRNSLARDLPPTSKVSPSDFKGNTTVQYFEVDSIDEVMKNLRGVPILMEPVVKPYGMREVLVRDPSGYLIEFAEKVK
jgi:catechol 2,3-dioxygenase-like lactoylglutathione lyase family enzyme